MKVKLLIIASVAALLILVILVAIPLFVRYDEIETNKELENIMLLYENGEEARGVSSEGETLLSYVNLARVVTLLSYTERTIIFIPPKESVAEASFRINDIDIRIVSEPSEGYKDKVLIYYTNGHKKRCYSLTGYNTLVNVTQALSPEGYRGENTVV